MFRKEWLTTTAGVVLGIGGMQAVHAACTGDPVQGVVCDPQGAVAVGAVFASDSGTRRNVSLALVEDLLEEEAEETGGGAGDRQPYDVYAALAYSDKDFDTQRVPGLNSDSIGGVIGAMLRDNRYLVGAALDYSNEDADLDENAGSVDTDEFGVQLYGIYYPMARRNLFLSAAARYAWTDIDTKRKFLTAPTAVNPGVPNTAKGDTDGHKFGVLGGVGYGWAIAPQTVATLSGWLSWQRNVTDAYTESGALIQQGPVTGNLRFEEDSYSTLDGIVTLDLGHAMPISNGRLVPSASVSFVHEFESDTRTIDARLADVVAPTDPTKSVFSFRTNDADRNYFRVGAALTAEFDRGTTVYASYSGTVGHDWRNENLFTLGIGQAF